MTIEVPTSAGLCRLPDDPGVCLSCFQTRVRRAGFAITGEPRIMESFRSSASPSAGALQDFSTPVHRLSNGAIHEHTLLPVPGCPRCKAREARNVRAPDSSTPSFRPLSVETLADPFLGITGDYSVRDPADGRNLCYSVTGRVRGPEKEESLRASGAAFTLDAAAIGQLGEAAERYAALHPDPRVLLATFAEVGVDPSLYSGYSEDQLHLTGYESYQSDDEIAWVKGIRLRDGREGLAPAAAVYLTRSANPGERRHGPLVSSGLAAHTAPSLAEKAALSEAVERFALARAWYSGDLGFSLPLSLVPDAAQEMLYRVQAEGIRIGFVLIPAAIPVVIAWLAADHFPWIALGTAADQYTEQAAARGMLEAALVWSQLAGIPPAGNGNSAAKKSFADMAAEPLPPVCDPELHTIHYAEERRGRALLARLQSLPPATAKQMAEVGALEDGLVDLAEDTMIVDITTEDLRACGFTAVKAVTPGLPTLAFGRAGSMRRHLERLGLPWREEIHPFP